jgi:hypothetical protein
MKNKVIFVNPDLYKKVFVHNNIYKTLYELYESIK